MWLINIMSTVLTFPGAFPVTQFKTFRPFNTVKFLKSTSMWNQTYDQRDGRQMSALAMTPIERGRQASVLAPVPPRLPQKQYMAAILYSNTSLTWFDTQLPIHLSSDAYYNISSNHFYYSCESQKISLHDEDRKIWRLYISGSRKNLDDRER